MSDALKTVGSFLSKHGDKIPTILRLGEALFAAVGGDEVVAMKAIRDLEVSQRRARDKRMGR